MTISCNYIGVGSDGVTASPSSIGSVGYARGIELSSTADDVIIENNIAGSRRTPIMIEGNSGDRVEGSIIRNNLLGVDVSMQTKLPTDGASSGIYMDHVLNTNIGESDNGNVIGGQVQGVSVYHDESHDMKANYIGTAPDGMRVNNGNGVYLGFGFPHTDIRIGGTTVGERNIFSGNDNAGINGRGDIDGLIVRGNYFGLAADGTTARANDAGIRLDGNLNNVDIGGSTSTQRNYFTGNTTYGLEIFDRDNGTNANKVRGNIIGLDRNENTMSTRTEVGVRFYSGGFTLGGDSTAGEGNVISGNKGNATIIGGNVADADELFIYGNIMGLKSDGETPAGNGPSWVTNDIRDNIAVRFGGNGQGQGNIVTANEGIGVVLISVTDTHVVGNKIGLTKSGQVIGNGTTNTGETGIGLIYPWGYSFSSNTVIDNNEVAGHRNYGITMDHAFDGTITNNTVYQNGNGIRVMGDDSNNNVIEYNTIHDNENEAVAILKYPYDGQPVYNGSDPIGNTIRFNSIYRNGSQGIDLGGQSPDGFTSNDNHDDDSGANNLQNYPVKLTMRSCDGSSQGPSSIFHSTPNTTFTLDFYSNPSWNAGEPLQAETWHSSVNVSTDSDGNAPLNVPGGLVNPTYTATAPDGSTSEIGGDILTSISDCSMDITTNDNSGLNYLYFSWDGSNIASTGDDTWSVKRGYDVTISIDGQPFDIDPNTDSNHYYSFSDGGGYAYGTIAGELSEGGHDVTITLTDSSTGLSMSHTFVDGLTVDTTPPPTPTVTSKRTNDTTPELIGTAPQSDYVYVEICTQDGSTCYYPYDPIDYDSQTGKWTLSGDQDNYVSYQYDPDLDDWVYKEYTLPEGTYDVFVYSYDGSNNEAVDITTDELVIDLTEPVGTATAVVGARTASPELTGTVDDPEAIVTATVNGKSFRSINNGDDTWMLSAGVIDSITTAGTYGVSVAFTDEAGNESSAPTTMSLVILPGVGSIEDNGGKPIVHGTYDAQNSQRLRVRVNNVWYTLGTNPQLTTSGNSWTLNLSSLSTPLAPGQYAVMAESTALDGEVMGDESNATLVVVLGAPSSGVGNTLNVAPFIWLLGVGALIVAAARLRSTVDF